eukprot:TRINITY_DN1864_c0_g1_i2.p1 TRINITY_DN1864_c0_g1~~TRINITY_DN1864_c0_g1_i2.p1  ORF type:complete len:396 (+),score=69.61 TRINITY_DN1864_c0_g1_i2:26-1189(+)
MTHHLFLGLDRPCFVPGHSVDGIVVFHVASEIEISSISIDFTGHEFTSWYQGPRQLDHSTDTVNFLEDSLVLWSDDESGILQPGTYTHPFSYVLPDRLPGSYEEFETQDTKVESLPGGFIISENSLYPRSFGDERSRVRYTAVAKITVPASPDIDEGTEESILLEVSRNLQITENFDPEILHGPPIVKSKSQSFFLAGNPLSMTVSVSRGGVIFCGESLNLNILLNNTSKRKVDGLFFKIVRHVTCTGKWNNKDRDLHRKDIVVSSHIPDSHVFPGDNYSEDVRLDIGSYLPPTIRNGQLVQRHYEIVISAEMPLSGKVEITIPLLILGWSPIFSNLMADLEAVANSHSVIDTTSSEEVLDNVADEYVSSTSISSDNLGSEEEIISL